MPHIRVPRSIEQMGLFHPRARSPRWVELPIEVQQQTLSLVMQLLRLHYRRPLVVEEQAKGARDE